MGMRTLFFDAAHRLVDTLERLRTTLTKDSDSGGNGDSEAALVRQLLDTINHLTSHYEVVVWEVLMPHLIRNAPALASDTVATLQTNHQEEKQLREVFKPLPNAGLADSVWRQELLDSAARLTEVLGDSLMRLETEVWSAFEVLSEEERRALIAVVEHEHARLEGSEAAPPTSVSRAIDVLESDRASLPV